MAKKTNSFHMFQFKRLTAAFAVVAAVAAGVAPARADPLTFRGEVARGDTVVHRFKHEGAGLEFRLAPITHGWIIWIGNPKSPEQNYVTPATPPFRGINPIVIEGWHFRNADNTGPNAPGPGNVNAPQEERAFAFVLDPSGRREAAEALDIILWPNGRDETAVKAAEERWREIVKAEGRLRVEAMELGNLAEGEHAWIERMAFAVTIDLPTIN